MAYSKTDQFSESEIQAARVAKALGHPARIAILELLAKKSTCICGDIVNELPLSQSTVSQHLKELKTAGLIKGNIDGPKVCYCIDVGFTKKAKTFFDNIFNKINSCNC